MLYGCGQGFFTPFIDDPKATTLQPITIFQYLLDHPYDQIIQLDIKYNNVLLRSQFGQVLGCGLNEHGELMLNDQKLRKFPVPIFKKIKHCALGFKCSIFLDFDGIVTWCQQGKTIRIDGSHLRLEKVVIINGDVPFAIAQNKAFRVKSKEFVECTQSGGGGEYDFYFARGPMKYKYESKYGQVTVSGKNIREFFTEVALDSIHFNSVGSKIVKVEASENHLINLHMDNYLTAFGNNQFGQLGTGSTYNHEYSHEAVGDDCFEKLYFDYDESLELDVFVGSRCTVAVTYCKENIQIDKHAKNLLQNLIIIDSESESKPTLKVYFPLVELISPDLCKVLKYENLLKNFSLEELNLTRELVLYICESIPSKYSNQDILLNKYNEDVKSLTTFLFLLNDIQDCGQALKEAIFSKISSYIQIENVMQIISQTSDYLSRKVLKNSHNSILMLLVKKCIAFIKENYSQVQNMHGADEKLIKLSSRIEESKQSFDSIEVKWYEDIFTTVSSLSEAIKLCAQSNTDRKLIIDNNGTEIPANRQMIAKSSPVLETFFEKYSPNTNSYNVYEFVKTEGGETQQEKSEALKILLSEACCCDYTNLSLCSDQTFIYILSMSHQFEMHDLTKECCKIMFTERLTLSNLEVFTQMAPIFDEDTNMRMMVFLLKSLPQESLLSMTRHESLQENMRKKLKEYLKIIYSHNTTPLWMTSPVAKEELTEEEMLSTVNFIAHYKGPEDYERGDDYYD